MTLTDLVAKILHEFRIKYAKGTNVTLADGHKVKFDYFCSEIPLYIAVGHSSMHAVPSSFPLVEIMTKDDLRQLWIVLERTRKTYEKWEAENLASCEA